MNRENNTMTIMIYTKDNKTINTLTKEAQLNFSKNNLDIITPKEIDDIMTFLKKNGQNIDILFFDIDFSFFNYKTLHLIEKSKKISYVVFIAGNDSLLPECFCSKTRGFLKKPLTSDKYFKKTLLFLKKIIASKKNNILCYNYYGEKKSINVNDIEFIKAFGRYSNIICTNEEIFISKNIGLLEDNLCETDIVRIHKSYMININFVKKIKSRYVILLSGKILPIGAKFSKNVHNLLQNS